MKKYFTLLWIGVILSILLLSACSQAVTPTPTLVKSQVLAGGNAASAYPVGGGATATPEPGQGYPGPSTSKIYGPDESPTVPATAPQPQPGMGSVSGTLFSYTTRVTLPQTKLYLTKAGGNNKIPALFVGPDVQKGDIIAWTDGQGQFTLNNISPGAYYMAVWDNYSWAIVVDPTKDPAPARLIEIQAGQQLPLGLVEISWP